MAIPELRQGLLGADSLAGGLGPPTGLELAPAEGTLPEDGGSVVIGSVAAGALATEGVAEGVIAAEATLGEERRSIVALEGTPNERAAGYAGISDAEVSAIVLRGLDASQQESQILNYLSRRVVRREPFPKESDCRAYTRFALKALAPAISMWGNVYYFPVNMKAAGGNKVWGGVLCGGSSVAVVALNSWATWSLVDTFVGKKSPEEIAMKREEFSCPCDTVVNVSAFALGMIAQSAIAYVASISNGNRILPAVVLFLSDGPIPIYSCKLSLQALLSSRKNEFERELMGCRDALAGRLSHNRKQFLLLDRRDQMRFVEEARAIEEDEERGVDEEGAGWELFDKLTMTDVPEKEDSRGVALAKGGIYGLGIGLALSHQYLFAQIGYEAVSRLSGSDVAGYVGGAVVGGANLYLNGVSVADTAVSLFQNALDYWNGEYVPSMSEQLRPAASVIIKIVGIVCSILSYGGSLGMAKDAFTTKWLQETFGTTVSISFALFTLSAFLILSAEALDYSIKNGTEEDEQKLIEFDEAWRALIMMLNIAPEKEIALFVLKTPLNILGKVTSDPMRMKAIARSYLEGVTTSKDENFQQMLTELREADAGRVYGPVLPPGLAEVPAADDEEEAVGAASAAGAGAQAAISSAAE